MTTTDSDDVGPTVMIEDVVMTVSDAVSLVTGVLEVVSLLVGVAVAESVAELVEESLVPPVERPTL